MTRDGSNLTFEETVKLKATVDANADARNRWNYRAIRIICFTFLAMEFMALVL